MINPARVSTQGLQNENLELSHSVDNHSNEMLITNTNENNNNETNQNQIESIQLNNENQDAHERINIFYYQQNNLKAIKNRGYIDQIKNNRNTRILSLNPNELRVSNDERIQQFLHSTNEYQIDTMMLILTDCI